MVKRVFGEVHMLSHLVGAANRADIRRLRQLEEETAALTAKLERQQKQLRDGFTSRDETIRRLNEMLARKVVDELASPLFGCAADAGVLKEAFAELDRRLSHSTNVNAHLAKRLESASSTLNETQRALQSSESERNALRQELASIETRIGALLQDEEGGSEAALDLQGLTVLYVGGRANQAPQLKRLVERTRGRFLHHDGGIEHNAALLPGLVSRADVAVFPVDCVSHDAAASVKRVCRQLGKRYVPLRSSSLTCLLSGLAAMQETEAASPVESSP
jgi:septal ring factor EnvC (AmiA/AmiB activator)